MDGSHIVNPVELQPYLGRYKTWSGTCFGHGGFFGPGVSGGPGIDTPVEFHEDVHTEQTEAALLVGLFSQLASVTVHLVQGSEPLWYVHVILWAANGLVFYAAGAVTAWTRGESLYMGNTNEESAYAQTTVEFPPK
jgi:hypothetical protein